MIARHSFKIAEYLSGELNLGTEDRETLRYGLEVIFGSMVKLLVLALVSLWLNIWPQVAAATVTSGGLRSLSGGVHCKRYSNCLVFGTVIAITISELSLLGTQYVSSGLLAVFISVTMITGFFAVKKWAPADNVGKPIKRTDKAAGYKKLSMLYVIIWGFFMLVMLGFAGKSSLVVSICSASVMSFCFQTISITPAGYRWIEGIDRLFDKGIRKGVNSC